MLRTIVATSCVMISNAGLGVTALDDDASPGVHALRFKRAPATWNGAKAVAYDGVITDHQAGSRTYDRRIAGGGAFGFENPLAPNLSVRLDLRAETVTRRQKMALAPETITDESYFIVRPNFDVTYITPASLEIFMGGAYHLSPAHAEKIESYSYNAENRYGPSKLFTPRFGLTRRAGVANGGVYYISGRESSRTITKVVGDNNDLAMTEPVFEPTTAAVFADFTARNINWTLEVAAISGSEGGLRSASGSTMGDDYMRFRIGGIWNNSFKAEIAHQTAGYAKSSYMILDNIPLTSLRLVFGDAATGMWTGLTYIYARDRQSIPEVNVEYKIDSIVLLTGVNRAI